MKVSNSYHQNSGQLLGLFLLSLFLKKRPNKSHAFRNEPSAQCSCIGIGESVDNSKVSFYHHFNWLRRVQFCLGFQCKCATTNISNSTPRTCRFNVEVTILNTVQKSPEQYISINGKYYMLHLTVLCSPWVTDGETCPEGQIKVETSLA